jgi:hypothetical protein
MQQSGLAFDAAEAAIAGVFFESEDETLLTDPNKTDPLSEARQGNVFDPEADSMSCFDDGEWTDMWWMARIKVRPRQRVGRALRLSESRLVEARVT